MKWKCGCDHAIVNGSEFVLELIGDFSVYFEFFQLSDNGGSSSF